MNRLRCVSLVSALGLLVSSHGQTDIHRDFVSTAKSAYMIMPPDFVCGPTVLQMVWSFDGEHLAVLRMVTDRPDKILKDSLAHRDQEIPDPEAQIVVWSPISHKPNTIFKLKQSLGNIEQLKWIPGSSQLVVIATLQSPTGLSQSQLSVNLISTSGVSSTVARLNPTIRYEIAPCPNRSLVALVEYEVPQAIKGSPTRANEDPNPATLRFFGTYGVISQPVTFPMGRSSLFWSTNGEAYALAFEKSKTDPKRADRVWYVANRSTNKFDKTNAPPDAYVPGRPEVLPELWVQDLESRIAVSKVGVSAPTVIICSTQDKLAQSSADLEPSVITTDGSMGQITPKLNAVSYKSQGSAMVRTLVKIPMEAYKDARNAVLRTKLLSQAKQVALGLIMNMTDNDNNLLSNKGDWHSHVQPYLKSNSLLDGFNYTFGDGPMDKIGNPSETQLGFVDGPGGRAVAYADGHVVWLPNP